MLRSEWLKVVDVRPTTQPQEGVSRTMSEFGGESASQKQSPSSVSDKVQGKRAAENEPTQKKRRTVDVAPCKPADISIDGGRTAQTQSAAMSKWSDVDEVPVAPPLSTKASSCRTHAEVHSKGGEHVQG